MEKIYLYLKDANIKKIKDFVAETEINKEDKSFGGEITNSMKNFIFRDVIADDDFKFTICLTKQEALSADIFEKVKNVIERLTGYGIKKQNLIFTVLDRTHRFEKEEWAKIEKLNLMLAEQEIKFGFEDHGKTWNIKQVKKANNALKKTAKQLVDKNLSPFEKIMATYFKVTSRIYNEEQNEEHFAQSRSVYGVLNSKRVVCVGYSEWFSAILNLTDDENIKTYQNGVQISYDNKYSEGGHRNLIVYVKDKKYNLDGYYYLDSTWDSAQYKNETPYDILNFMLPLTDIKEYKQFIRSDILFLHLDPSDEIIDNNKNRKEDEKNNLTSNKNNKFENENEYASLLKEIDDVKFGESDDNNNVSFSIDKYIYDGTFYNDLIKHIMHKNTLKDFKEIEVNNYLNFLNELLDRNKDISDNLKFIKTELINNNKFTLTTKELSNIANSENYVKTLIDIICNERKGNYKEYPLNTALTKLTLKLKNQQKHLEKTITKLMNANYDINYDEDLFAFYSDTVVQKTLNYLSTPIALNKIKHALKEYLEKFTELTPDEIKEKMEDIIGNNIFNSCLYHKASAQNAIAQASVEAYGKEHFEEKQ